MKDNPMAVLGLDAGTHNICASVAREGNVEVATDRGGNRHIPTVWAESAMEREFWGHTAKRQNLLNPSRTRCSWPDVSLASSVQASSAQASSEQASSAQASSEQASRIRSTEDLRARTLHQAKRLAEDYVGRSILQGVIAAPTHWPDSAKEELRTWAGKAGLEVLGVINEAEAAIEAYQLADRITGPVVVYQFGASSVEIALLEVGDGNVRMLSNWRETSLNGEQVQRRLYRKLVQDSVARIGPTVLEHPMALQRLSDLAERAMVRLSYDSQADIELPFLVPSAGGPHNHFQTRVTRRELELLVADLVQRSVQACEALLRDSGFSVNSIKAVVLTGGLSHMPMVQRTVSTYFDQPALHHIPPSEVVSLGAARHGGLMAGILRKPFEDTGTRRTWTATIPPASASVIPSAQS